MICAFDEYKLLWLRKRFHQPFQLPMRPELVVRAANEKLGLGAILEETEFIPAVVNRGHRQTQRDYRFHTRVRARGLQTDRSTKREAGKNQRKVKFTIEPVERDANIVHFATTIIVLALA